MDTNPIFFEVAFGLIVSIRSSFRFQRARLLEVVAITILHTASYY